MLRQGQHKGGKNFWRQVSYYWTGFAGHLSHLLRGKRRGYGTDHSTGHLLFQTLNIWTFPSWRSEIYRDDISHSRSTWHAFVENMISGIHVLRYVMGKSFCVFSCCSCIYTPIGKSRGRVSPQASISSQSMSSLNLLFGCFSASEA